MKPGLNIRHLPDFRVRRELDYLTVHNPLYGGIAVNDEFLALLPMDENVMDQVTRIEQPEQTIADGSIQQSTVPDMVAKISEVDIVRGRRQLSEFDRTARVIAGAFPSLMPDGNGDPNQQRERPVTMLEFTRHALGWGAMWAVLEKLQTISINMVSWPNGYSLSTLRQANVQFASHSRFALYMFDRIHRQRVLGMANVYAGNARNAPTTVEDIQNVQRAGPWKGGRF
ncbi:hypothetical protein E8E14_008088 [Neopestalotiopsis sp. 37M]|nr:hypothetical protein E8E14_008088 [Neopestalotiopsis sp. 37M]